MEHDLAVGGMDGYTDGTKTIPWASSPLPPLYRTLNSLPAVRVLRDGSPGMPRSPVLQQMPGAAQLPPEPQGLRPDSQGVGRKFSSWQRSVSEVPM